MSDSLLDDSAGPAPTVETPPRQEAAQAIERVLSLEPYMRAIARAVDRGHGGRGDAVSSKVQSAFLKAQEKILAGFKLPDQEQKLRGWVRSIVKRKAIDHHRKQDAWQRLRKRLKLPPGPVAPDEAAERAEIEHRLRAALRSLDDRDRWYLELYIFDELSYRQIAANQGMSFNGVGKAVKRALRSLQAAYLIHPSAPGEGGR